MLSYQKKAAILTRTGAVVPPFPARGLPEHDDMASRDGDLSRDTFAVDTELARAVAAWNRVIDILFVDYAAARAAKSLRDSEQASQLESLRRANGGARSASR